MSQKPKKGISTKTKIIIAVIGVVVLLAIGFYLGMRMQRAYNSIAFNISQSMISFSFYAVIILAILLVVLIFYLIYKMRHKG